MGRTPLTRACCGTSDGWAVRWMRSTRSPRSSRRCGAATIPPRGTASSPLCTANSLPSGAGSSEAFVPAQERAELLLELDEALTRLAALDERLVRVVECRFFAGLTEEETAAALGVTARTVRRDWVKAKGWLQRALEA